MRPMGSKDTSFEWFYWVKQAWVKPMIDEETGQTYVVIATPPGTKASFDIVCPGNGMTIKAKIDDKTKSNAITIFR